MDISEGMLNECIKKIDKFRWENIELIQGCAEYLPLKAMKFDRVLIGGAISYFSDYFSDAKKAVENAVRVAKVGGKIVLFEQITILEKLLGKDKPPIKSLPENVNIQFIKYIFDDRFYIVKLVKVKS